MKQKTELRVFITAGASTCGACGEALGRQAWITLTQEKVSLCLTCANLDHLIYLPARDVILTQRVRQHSTLVAVVLKWNRARKRYERQGLLVEAQALKQAEQEYLAVSEARTRRRKREATRQGKFSRRYIEHFARRVRKFFPGCPPHREEIIAEYACRKSGSHLSQVRVRPLDEKTIRLAVIAHIRHTETAYDTLLAQGCDYREARAQVAEIIERILTAWAVSG